MNASHSHEHTPPEFVADLGSSVRCLFRSVALVSCQEPANRDENIIDELKVTSTDAEECVESTISQSIVVRREVVSVRN